VREKFGGRLIKDLKEWDPEWEAQVRRKKNADNHDQGLSFLTKREEKRNPVLVEVEVCISTTKKTASPRRCHRGEARPMGGKKRGGSTAEKGKSSVGMEVGTDITTTPERNYRCAGRDLKESKGKEVSIKKEKDGSLRI